MICMSWEKPRAETNHCSNVMASVKSRTIVWYMLSTNRSAILGKMVVVITKIMVEIGILTTRIMVETGILEVRMLVETGIMVIKIMVGIVILGIITVVIVLVNSVLIVVVQDTQNLSAERNEIMIAFAKWVKSMLDR